MKNSIEGDVKAELKNVKIAVLQQKQPLRQSLDHGHSYWLIPQGMVDTAQCQGIQQSPSFGNDVCVVPDVGVNL